VWGLEQSSPFRFIYFQKVFGVDRQVA